ncbi:MAG: lactonase family protein [Gemmataceae bacterium]|nr:lactonase family protein [Gemmataceae bacterium]MDW8267080.1 lactonase family protein [Gemmataceae bacterium]
MLTALSWFRLGWVALALAAAGWALADTSAGRFWVFVGTSTGKKSKGIYRLEFDATTGQLGPAELAAETSRPTFLAIHPSQKFLYAVGELDGPKGGAVNAFGIDPTTGKLTFLNQQPSGGNGPCHVVVDQAGKHVLVANYGGGSASVLPIRPDGSLGPATAFVQHVGKSVNPRRQEAPHAHCINLDPANRFAFVADLGLDQVLIYRFDPDRGSLVANTPPHVAMAPGAGPRHFAFHPNGKWAYAINELDSTLTAMSYDAATGTLTKVQTESTLPKDFTGTNYPAEVVVHPSGKWVYGSNRGHNSIVVFAIDGTTGKLTLVGHQAHNIKTPRNFNLDPTGRWLIVANQDADSLVVFRIHPESGALESTGESAAVPTPMCVKFYKR